jgi:hypothetical protein
MSMQSIVDSGAKAAEQPVAQQVGSKWKLRFSKFAGKYVLVKLPSPYMSRSGSTTVDLWMSKEILSADGIHLGLDISTFYVFHQQSIYLFAFWV